MLSIATQWQKQGIIYRTIALLFVLELFQRCFYFAIAPYYMLPFMAFAACLNSVLIERAMPFPSRAICLRGRQTGVLPDMFLLT